MAHAAHEEIGFLILECSQGTSDCVFRPTLRVGFLGILQEAFKGGGQRIIQLRELELANQFCRFPHDEVVAIAECFLKSLKLLRSSRLTK